MSLFGFSMGSTQPMLRRNVALAFGLLAGGALWTLIANITKAKPGRSHAQTRASSTVAKDEPQSNKHIIASQVAGMQAAYSAMRDDFLQHGLDMAALSVMRPYFHGLTEPGGLPWPKQYSQFEPPLPPSSVRLLVIPFEDQPSLASLAAGITQQVAALLPPSTQVFVNARTQYHCTVFHTSHPLDPRPNPLAPDGGLSGAEQQPDPGHPGGAGAAAGLLPPPPSLHGPAAAELAAEAEAMAACVAAAQRPLLQLDRVVLARSGTLLMTWRDETGAVTGLRQALRRTFPGACAKQANIIHTSLLRILGPAQLPRETITAIVALCDKLTAKLAHHTQLAPSALWFIDETEFSTVVGDKQLLRLPA